ncbi:kinesin family member 2/24 [Angomonas deanei]|uniref:Kinesin-like protein n=1 Tax=Angomonas deanei TaxID=59799 RepID=A0A7G2CLX0_9TRYP|nr:kinesin family member 2/24 [Angomonas deanei]CAD2219921.1 Kinesin motor domain/Microtubule binding, putative [Angomonas deanei]|eukprot:EPY36016.1 kinesin family member 2/24 [Angomonas deanei]
MNNRICVAVRKRPIKEGEDVVETPTPNCIVNEPKIKYDLTPYTERHTFTYDKVFSEKDGNADLYRDCCLPLIETVFSNGNATCFAYGQTGSGKTHTMLGNDREPGLYAISAREIFARAKKLNADVFVSFYEIYGRKIFDLLNHRERLVAREDADKVINICGLSEHPVNTIEDIFDVITAGSTYRAAGQTSANAESSRSHAVLQIEVREANTGQKKGPKTIGRISFIDLAGNERGADTYECDRKTRMEGAEINKSLLALKECIRALGMGKSHVPFRGSILTEVLRDSFTGNSRTTMIATISPAASHCVNTLNTLRYTQRVKDLGGPSGGARSEQVASGAPAKRAPKRSNFQPAAAPKNRPEWVSDFAEDDGEVGNTPTPPPPAQKPKPKKVAKAAKKTEKAEVKVKDPKIATIVKNHIKALEVPDTNGEEDDDEEEEEEELAETTMPREEERQVRKVHAYVVDEITKAEEKLIALHRRHIDSKMTGIKEEIKAIQNFEESDSVDDYVTKVRGLLQKQMDDMQQILSMLSSISGMLKDEEDLSHTLNSSRAPRR